VLHDNIIPPLLVFQKVCFLYLTLSILPEQTFWSPTTILSPTKLYVNIFVFIRHQLVFSFKKRGSKEIKFFIIIHKVIIDKSLSN